MLLTVAEVAELRCILMMVRNSSLRIIDPELTVHVNRALDIVTTDADRARVAELRARLDEQRAGQLGPNVLSR